MSFPLYAVAAAAFLTLLTKIPVFIAQMKEGRYDNRHPRDQQARLSGWGRRALAAHQNAFEAFPMFAAGVLIATITGASPEWATALAATFLAARVVFTGLYIADISTARSLAWGVGFFSSIGLMLLKPLAG